MAGRRAQRRRSYAAQRQILHTLVAHHARSARRDLSWSRYAHESSPVTDLFTHVRAALASGYAIERELGRGGMATVYLAQDLKHRRPVAIKVLAPELAAALGRERFLREIETAARLSHPHILPLHDSGEADGFLYYVMPYVAGESLRDPLNREPQLPIEDAGTIPREVATAPG